jgi:hypothetical protein
MKSFFDPAERATKLSSALNQDLEVDNTDVVDPRYVGVYRKLQHDATLKKVEEEGDVQGLEEEAFASFLLRNSQLASVNQMLREKHLDDRDELGFVLRRAKHAIAWALRDVMVDEVYDACRHSTGVTQGVPFSDTSLNRKSSFPWTVTQRASSVVDGYDRYDPSYREACFTASKGFLSLVVYHIIEGSRATTVPKTKDKRRMIAVEPTGNMYLQQGLMHIMYRRLESIGLDVKTLPDRHRQLAFYGSVGRHLATLDLSNASDTVAYELVRLLFPPKWFMWLDQTRSPRMSISGQWVDVQAFATMGNATTFPVETLVFWSVCVGTAMLHRVYPHFEANRHWRYASLLSLPSDRENISVFGDDLIIPTDIAPRVMKTLGELGFTINTEKSFYSSDEPFRESCGGDFFHGRAVRPWYIRGPTTTSRIGLEAWLYVLANTLLEKYILYFGCVKHVYERHAYRLIFEWLRECTPLVKVVPSSFPDDSGLKGLEGLRLARTYLPDDRISPVGRSTQGWYNFAYLRYRYPRSRKVAEALAYSVWLKRQAKGKQYPKRWYDYLPSSETVNVTPVRKKGEYIVARATSVDF